MVFQGGDDGRGYRNTYKIATGQGGCAHVPPAIVSHHAINTALL
jgi:hypothetical protein